MRKDLFSVVIGMISLVFAGCSQSQQIQVSNLKLEQMVKPLGVNVTQPRFSWQIASSAPDLVQTTYQIQVAADPAELKAGKNLLWDSGVVTSDASIWVSYGGKALEPGKYYYWRVKIGTNQGATGWSEIERWSMAPDPASLKALWIGEDTLSNTGENFGTKENNKTRIAARYLRKEFDSDKKDVERAMLYVSGLGSSETYLNGEKVSEDIFAPMVSQYDKRVYFNTYDVTGMIAAGKNTIGVVLGAGRFFNLRNPGHTMFGLPRLFAQLEIEYTDGTTSLIISDTSWKVTSKGPIIANNEFDGEEYDARLEMPDWNRNGYDDSAWQQADRMESPAGKLTAQQNPNLQIQDRLKPVAVFRNHEGNYILDMGQNMVGWLSIDLNGKKDQPVHLRFAETLNPDSTLYVANLRTARAEDIYIPAADGRFHWHPSFVYHGFRFVEVSGLDYQPDPADFTGDCIYDKMETTGTFETSDKLVTQIFKNAYWGVRDNYRGMPTDCPQRDERLGWMGDRVTGTYGEAYFLDNSRMYNKWLQDVEDAMSPEGSISVVSPSYWTIYNDDVTWPAAFFTVADMLYHQYGDDQAIRLHYPAMKKWMRHMESTAMKDNIITKDTYGDWCMPPESPELIHSADPSRITNGSLMSTALYYDLLRLMTEFANICGQDTDIPHYKELSTKMKEAYNAKFFDPATAQYDNNTVTANILSLRLGLVPKGYERKVFQNIVDKTEKEFDSHVSCGVLGMQHLMRGLSENGRTDLAYRILTNTDYPSFGYMIRNGATTIWELWNGNTANPAMNSGNHVMLLGDLIIWYYEDLAGIRCYPGTVGYKKLWMAPVFPDGLDEIDASYKSVYGEIRSAWSRKDGRFEWDITIPGNTSAVVRIPKAFGVTVAKVAGIHAITEGEDYTEVEIGSGHYHFEK